MNKVNIFEKWVKLQGQGQKLWYDVKGLVTRNTHVKCEIPVSHGSKVMTKVKVLTPKVEQ